MNHEKNRKAAEERIESLAEYEVQGQRVLARNLRVFRAYHNISQSEVADRAGISRSYLSDIEQGQANPRVSIMGRLAAAYRMRVAALFLELKLPELEEANDE